MSRRPGRGTRWAACAALAILQACGSGGPSGPERPIAEDAVRGALSGADPGLHLDSAAYLASPAAWEAFLDETGPVESVEILERERLETTGRTVVDVLAHHPGGGTSTLSAHLDRDSDGRWRVRWIRGPAGSWPPGV